MGGRAERGTDRLTGPRRGAAAAAPPARTRWASLHEPTRGRMLFERDSKFVVAVRVSHEVPIRYIGREQRCLDARSTRRRNGPGGQSAIAVCVVGGVDFEIAVQHAGAV